MKAGSPMSDTRSKRAVGRSAQLAAIAPSVSAGASAADIPRLRRRRGKPSPMYAWHQERLLAFTLIELLVVIASIAILAAMWSLFALFSGQVPFSGQTTRQLG